MIVRNAVLPVAVALCLLSFTTPGGVRAQGADPGALDFPLPEPLSRQPSGLPMRDADIRAQLRSTVRTTLAAGLSGRISSLTVREGGRVEKGQVLAAFDCDAEKAALRGARARVDAAVATLKADERQVALGTAGQVTLDISKAEVAVARSQAEMIEIKLRACTVMSPFDGVVVTRHANPHQYAAEGEPLLDLMDTSALEADMVVPSRWLVWLVPGAPFTITLDETGATLEGVVDRTGGVIDPVSQSIRIIGRIIGDADDLVPGMSGTVSFADRS